MPHFPDKRRGKHWVFRRRPNYGQFVLTALRDLSHVRHSAWDLFSETKPMNPETAVDPTARDVTADTGRWRLLIGFSQGLGAWGLLKLAAPSSYDLTRDHPGDLPFWSERHPMVFGATALVVALIPIIAVVGLGRLRRLTLGIYLAGASVVVAGLGAYDLWREPRIYPGLFDHVRVWPSFRLTFCASFGLFIFNQLLEHRARDYSLLKAYASHYEDCWMRGFQLVVSLIFALLVWGILELGAALFGLIHVEWFRTLIKQNWFLYPVLAMSFAASIQLTDVRPALLKGMRNVGMTLLSWLLPLVVAVSVAFLAALAWVGIKPLWETRHAASILLWACSITLVLLNAAYKDGEVSTQPPRALRWAGRLAGPTMLAFSLIASYAIYLRVNQYGWTPDRFESAAVALLACVYGSGYTVAAAQRLPWMKSLETVNVLASVMIIGILVLLLTPIGDPARVSVTSQVARLTSGRVSPSGFDYQFLQFDAGRYGLNAIHRLSESTNPDIRSRAALMKNNSRRRYNPREEGDAAVTEQPFSHAEIYPEGATLPQDFSAQDWTKDVGLAHECLKNGAPCAIYVVAHGPDGATALVVQSLPTPDKKFVFPPTNLGSVFERDAGGRWVHTGEFDHLNCPAVVAALKAGAAERVRPDHDDVIAGGVRLRLSSRTQFTAGCGTG